MEMLFPCTLKFPCTPCKVQILSILHNFFKPKPILPCDRSLSKALITFLSGQKKFILSSSRYSSTKFLIFNFNPKANTFHRKFWLLLFLFFSLWILSLSEEPPVTHNDALCQLLAPGIQFKDVSSPSFSHWDLQAILQTFCHQCTVLATANAQED